MSNVTLWSFHWDAAVSEFQWKFQSNWFLLLRISFIEQLRAWQAFHCKSFKMNCLWNYLYQYYWRKFQIVRYSRWKFKSSGTRALFPRDHRRISEWSLHLIKFKSKRNIVLGYNLFVARLFSRACLWEKNHFTLINSISAYQISIGNW